jgi:hypothetical protein
MREKAAAKRKQTMQQKEEEAKKQVLENLQEEEPEQPEPNEPIQVTKKKTRPVQEGVYHNPSLSEEDIKIVKSYVQMEREKRKAEKWKARKQEILSEVFNLFEGDDESEETQQQYRQQQPQQQPQQSNLNLFDNYYY